MAIRNYLIPGGYAVCTQTTRQFLTPGGTFDNGASRASFTMVANVAGSDTSSGAMNGKARAQISGVNTLTAYISPNPGGWVDPPGGVFVNSKTNRQWLIPGGDFIWGTPKPKQPSTSMAALLTGLDQLSGTLSGGRGLGGGAVAGLKLGLGLGLTALRGGGGSNFTPPTNTNYMFCCTRLEMPQTASPMAVPDTNHLSLWSKIFVGFPHNSGLPVTNIRFCFANFCCYGDGTVSSLGGYEDAPGNVCTIDGAAFELAGTRYRITFSGSNSVVIPSGGIIWSDDIINPGTGLALSTSVADATGFVISSHSVPNGGNYTGGVRVDETNTPNPGTLGESYSFSAAPQTSFIMSGTPTTLFNRGSGALVNIRAPVSAVAKGWDGTTPVMMIAGDSIATGAGASINPVNYDSRGNHSYPTRGLDDNTVSTRMAFCNFGVSGSNPQKDASAAIGHYGFRLQIINGLPNIPYTTFFSEAANNSIGGGLANFKSIMNTWWAFIRSTMPSLNNWIVQSSIGPFTSSTDFWTTLANQSATPAVNTYPTGERWLDNAWLLGGANGPPTAPDAQLNVTTTMVDQTGGANDLWIVNSFASTLAAPLTGGGTNQSIVLNDPGFPIGGIAIIGTGTSQETVQVACNSVSGTGPYTLSPKIKTLAAHSIGEQVLVDVGTADNIHLAPNVTGLVAVGPIATAKNNGVFK